jgi:vacuolar-type H+-ATPase subunit H
MTRDSVQATDLTRLLDTERRLAERLRSARGEAESLIAQARTDVEQREAGLAAELEADERRMAERLARERRKREREITDEAQRQVDAYASVSGQRLGAVVHTLASRLLDDESAP